MQRLSIARAIKGTIRRWILHFFYISCFIQNTLSRSAVAPAVGAIANHIFIVIHTFEYISYTFTNWRRKFQVFVISNFHNSRLRSISLKIHVNFSHFGLNILTRHVFVGSIRNWLWICTAGLKTIKEKQKIWDSELKALFEIASRSHTTWATVISGIE